MDRQTASRLVSKLDALANDQAASGPEKKLAAAKARTLRAKYDLRAQPRRARPRAPRPRRQRFVYVDEMPDVHINFDPSTGKATKGTKVHHYQGPGNWRIEVPL